MTKFLFTTALLLGAMAIIWISSAFVDANVLALSVTVIIGCVYSIGVIELFYFRHATATLTKALSEIQGKVGALDEWIQKLDASLRVSVRLNIDGNRTGLPAPVLTPYLVGLLVMLGLLGTFVGMVDTLKGAVVALESTMELSEIREGLASPIRGLSLAFGTSVAGVTASAMLGLMSTLSRRDRILAKRDLDSRIPTVFKEFSLAHNQRETFKALQVQTQALPGVADKLSVMIDKLDGLREQLVTNQDAFHTSVKSTYQELAVSVDKKHKENLVENIRQVGESMKPILQKTMSGISEESQNVHNELALNSERTLKELSRQFVDTSEAVSSAWEAGLLSHTASNRKLMEFMTSSLEAFREKFNHMAESMLISFNKTSDSLVENQESSDLNRLDIWTDSFENLQKESAVNLTQLSKNFTDELRHVGGIQKKSLEASTGEFLSMASSLTSEFQKSGENTICQQQKMTDSLKNTANEIRGYAEETTARLHKEVAGLLKSSEDWVNTRMRTEEEWLGKHGARMNTLTATIKAELEALRNDEELRVRAAVNRFENLESALAVHLAKLGKELETPMSRLIQSTAEVPRAASEAIGQLRKEISKNVERDNRLLEEHQRIIKELDSLSQSLTLSSDSQYKAIEQLVDSSGQMLEKVAQRFVEHVNKEVSEFSGITDNFAVSAVEMASLGDSFSTAVDLFNTSNDNLVEKLERMEISLEKTTSRSDEQMAYYVAQARQIIDYCMLSQKGIFEELQQLRQEKIEESESSEWKN